MSIVRIGLGETKGYADGYDAIFGPGKKKKKPVEKAPPASLKATAKPKAKPAKKRGSAKNK